MRSMNKVTLALGGLGASWSIADSHNRVRLATSQQPPALTLWECPVGGFSSNLAGLKVAGHLTRDHGRRAQSAAETYFVCFLTSLNPVPWWQRWTKSSVVHSRPGRVRSRERWTETLSSDASGAISGVGEKVQARIRRRTERGRGAEQRT